MFRATALATAIICIPHTGVYAQARYEAASVKRSEPAGLVVPAIFRPNGQWSAQGAPLAMLLRAAYGVDRFEGLPRSMANERFDVVTTAAPGASAAQLRAMARQLLAERFNLRARVEQRILPATVLVRVDPDALGSSSHRAPAAPGPPVGRGQLD